MTRSAVVGRIRRAWHLWCAREDLRRHGVRIPAGLWLCDRCDMIGLDPSWPRRHAFAH